MPYTKSMSEGEIIDIIRETIWLCLKLSVPVMAIGLVIGVAVALLQALTQIQEMTLVFVPKIIAIFAALFALFPMMTTMLVEFMNVIADKIVIIE